MSYTPPTHAPATPRQAHTLTAEQHAVCKAAVEQLTAALGAAGVLKPGQPPLKLTLVLTAEETQPGPAAAGPFAALLHSDQSRAARSVSDRVDAFERAAGVTDQSAVDAMVKELSDRTRAALSSPTASAFELDVKFTRKAGGGWEHSGRTTVTTALPTDD